MLARTLSDTFTGISWRSAPAFIVAQLIGGALCAAAVRGLYPAIGEVAAQVMVPHGNTSPDKRGADGTSNH